MRRLNIYLAAAMIGLPGCGAEDPGQSFSLTGEGFAGKKHYFGFGEYLSGFMGNEVKYDVRHTHDIFTSGAGGHYESNLLIDRHVGGRDIRGVWNDLDRKISRDDMYVQYSSGHGSHSGLAVGVSYDDIRDFALDSGAKEVVVFLMACYSGNLVRSFERQRQRWSDWSSTGRTLMVLASSRPHQTSATGPRRDADEPGGPDGSAGSAFGHALWKALIGYADGFDSGVRDGHISLGEIVAFTTWKTEQVGRHTPIATGIYEPQLIMNQVPARRWLAERGESI